MRIGLVTACYHPVVNGVTRMLSLYRRHLGALGHEVTVFTLGQPVRNEDQARVVRSPAIPIGQGYYFSLRYNRRAQARLRQMDIVHCHHLMMGAEMAQRYSNCPIVLTNHTRYDVYAGAYLPLPQWVGSTLMRLLWPRLTGLVDVVVAPSNSLRLALRDLGVRQPIEVIANGIDLQPFRNPRQTLTKRDLGLRDSTVLCIYVGRLSSEKSVDALLAQFAIAQRLVPDMHLLLVGSGRQHNQLKHQAQHLGISRHVHFNGEVPCNAVPAYLAAADMFVTASHSDVHPLTVMEAMAAGLPVVAPAAPGMLDMVEHTVTGLLSSNQQRGLASAMRTLATDTAQRQRLGRAAQEASERFDIQRTIEQTQALYERLHSSRPDLQRRRANGR